MLNVGIVGASGLVGRNIISILEERNFHMDELRLYASRKSKDKEIYFNDKTTKIEELNEGIFEDSLDMVFFAAGGAVSEKYIPQLTKRGVICIDNSSSFRMREDVGLVVPEVNPEDVNINKTLIANPNCSTIQSVVALKPLYDKYGIERIIYSTYQAVSGSGQRGLNDLDTGRNDFYPYPIKNNVIPHIDAFLDDGYTKEEMKMINETKKILHDENLKITATTVRVPVRFGHSISINVELKTGFDLDDVRETLSQFNGIIVVDDAKNNKYPMPIHAQGRDEVFVGRIRRDYSVENGLNLWVVADNIRKGAATNAVQIGELLIKEGVLS
ncbi:aspartate-semialdehyde dehydrogenase [Soehngenia saccharolytica]|nr:aspartate-semialdehyde dehydrogenase [Soehngenia saccharolytica]